MLTLTEAAKRAGRSKSALLKAIKAGRLSAERLPDGSYSVDLSELFRVYPQSANQIPPPENSAHQQQATEHSANLERRVHELERERDFLRDRLEARDRDVERLTLLLTGPRNDEHQTSGSWRKWWAVGLGTVLVLALSGWALFLVLRQGV